MNDKSKHQVVDTPQDSSFLPTLAVMVWLGWYGGAPLLLISAILSSNVYYKTFVFGALLLSLMLPRNFPQKYGVRIGYWMAKHGRSYFGLKTIVEDVDAIEKYAHYEHSGDDKHKEKGKAVIFACEPHDILPYSVFAFNPSLNVLPGKVGETGCALMTGAAFKVPFMRQVFSWIGGDGVDKKTFRYRLKHGLSVAFCPGGVQEVLNIDPSKPDELILFLKKRKGFVKLALEQGCPIVPVFSFNLDGSFGYFLPRGKIVAWISRTIGFLPILFWGRFYIPFGIPFPQKISVVMGKPIDIPKVDTKDIPAEIVDKYHSLYINELIALFERHKVEEGYGDKTLKII